MCGQPCLRQERTFILFYENILMLELCNFNVFAQLRLICFHQPLISMMVWIKVLIMALCFYLNSVKEFLFACFTYVVIIILQYLNGNLLFK